jgi:F-type H+-transporting ATPase subunit gamma
MKGTRDIRRRIRAVKNTSQITRAMQLVATAKMKRAQEAAKANRPYALVFQELVATLPAQLEEVSIPLLQPRPVHKRCILLITTNRGLCGPLNTHLLRLLQWAQDDVLFVCVGKQGLQFLSRAHKHVAATFDLPDIVTFQSMRVVVEYMLRLFNEGTVDTLEVAYASHVNTLVQEPVIEMIAPMVDLHAGLASLHKQYKLPLPQPPTDKRIMTFEPSAQSVLEALVVAFIKHKVFHCFLEARAAEHSARMVAMKTATDNATRLVQDLTLQYNKARQAAITQEILEIAAAR